MDRAVGEAGHGPARTVNLALQGGGAHGAFTWGVLDRLLEDGRLGFEGISGTSAGAVNGAVVAYGLTSGGPETARRLLRELWTRIARQSVWSPLQPAWSRPPGWPNLDFSPGYAFFDAMVRSLSPYIFNPFGWNPLRDLLQDVIDFEVLRRSQDTRLYISATDVLKGRLKIFTGEEISVDALIASACLPFLFQAVEIGGAYYWDGGYMGNPTIYPLLHACQSRDTLVIQVNPITRDRLPVTPTAIVDRMNEVSFNSTFMREARALELINRLLASGHLDEGECGLRPMYLHLIGDETALQGYEVSSKLNADWDFIHHLHELGRAAAGRWLDAHWDKIGVESTFTVGGMLA